MKCCVHCGGPAEVSLCGILSTLGVSNRRQKCTAALPLCFACLQQWVTNEGVGPAGHIAEALQIGLRALTDQAASQMSPTL